MSEITQYGTDSGSLVTLFTSGTLYEPDHVIGPDVIYSSMEGPVVQFDGACYSRPRHIPSIQNADDILIVSSGTNLIDCAVVECGPVGLYCYESIDSPQTSILALQPLHFPTPVVSLAENRTRCYHNPAFIKAVIENYGTIDTGVSTAYGSYAQPVEVSKCGVAYRYQACNGDGEIVVVDENSPTILYGGSCWSDPEVVVTFGTDITVVAGTDTTPVSGCTDILCTGSNSQGATVTYVDQQRGLDVNVEFAHLDVGIPYFGVSPEFTDDGENGLQSGMATISLSKSKPSSTIIQSVPAAGRIELSVVVKGYRKNVIRTRGGVDTAYRLSPDQSQLFLDVEAGDRLRVELDAIRAGIARPTERVSGHSRWKSAPLSYRVYDQTTLHYVGTTSVNAVSFCGLSARTPYVFFGTLPAVTETSYPNPDTYLTVQGASGPEYVLVTAHATAERVPVGPDDTVAYAGESIVGPLTFRFYTGRGAAGAHGEMDVWLDTPGVFPPVFAAGDYAALSRPETWYRRDAQVGDTRRSTLRVAQQGHYYTLPGVYASDMGDVIVAEGPLASSVTSSGTVYSLTGTAYGLAYSIVQASPA